MDLADLEQIPGLEDEVCDALCRGNFLADVAEKYKISPWMLQTFMHSNSERSQKYTDAAEARQEIQREKVHREIERIGLCDITQIYNDNGDIKPMSEWPADVRASISEIESKEEYDHDAEKIGGLVRKVKTNSKLQALKMLSARIEELKPLPVEHEVNIKYEDLIGGSWGVDDDE